MEGFAGWVQSKLDEKGWSRLEAARRGEISASMFDKVINGYANPGPDFCTGVARAFGIPPEDVFRRAGLLPELTYGTLEDGDARELYTIIQNLPTRERRDVIEYARMRYRLLHEDRERYQVERKSHIIGEKPPRTWGEH